MGAQPCWVLGCCRCNSSPSRYIVQVRLLLHRPRLLHSRGHLLHGCGLLLRLWRSCCSPARQQCVQVLIVQPVQEILHVLMR